MKRLSLILISICFCATLIAQDNDPVLLRIGDTEITKSEFIYNYKKNNNESILESKSADEYLDLFVNFKLKVIDAQMQGLDTTAAFIEEFKSYRSQLTEPYLIDTLLEKDLLRQAYDHMSQDCDVWHVLIGLDKNATEKDTLEAYQKALKVKELLQTDDFEKVADEYSTDPSVSKNHGHLGYLTAMQTIWLFEKAMYDLPLNAISEPIRTAFGYHVIKVTDRRPSWGQVHAAHIMKICNDKMSEQAQKDAYKKIMNTYNRIQNGESFETLARTSSDDRSTAAHSGDLNWFGINHMVPEFEKTAFALDIDQISEPVKTQFGWHIIKVYGKRSYGTFEEEKPRIKQMMQYDTRSIASRLSFVEKLKEEYNFTLNENILNKITAAAEGNTIPTEIMDELNEPLFVLNNTNFSAQAFVLYCNNNDQATISDKLQAFIFNEILAYEDSRLEEKHPQFKLLMQEYHDGMLLFETSNQNVWNKSVTDDGGLTKFFQKNRNKYKWSEPRFKGAIVRCKDAQTAALIKKRTKNISIDSLYRFVYHTLNNDSIVYARVERGLWKKGDNAIVDSLVFKQSDANANMRQDLPCAIVIGKKLKKPESYKDVRGAISADYQALLEQKWLNDLYHRYDIYFDDILFEEIKQELAQ